MNSGQRFKRRFFKTSVLGRMLGDLLHRGRREQSQAVRRSITPRGERFALETMEPRVLMSADIAYAPTSLANTITVSASVSGGAYFIDIAGGVASPIHRQLTAPGDVTINIAPVGGAAAGATLADTVRVNLDTFSVLKPFVNANGGLLTLDIAGGSELIQQDRVFIDGLAANIGYSLNVHSSADMTAAATATLTGNLTLASDDAVVGTSKTNLKALNLTLRAAASEAGGIGGTGILADANSRITLTDATLTAVNLLSLDAHAAVSVDATGIPIAGVTGSVVTSASSARIAIGGASVLSGKAVDITARVEGTLKATAALNVVKLVVVTGMAAPEVLISGTTSITATNALTVTAKSDVVIDATVRPSPTATIAKADAAVVTTTFASGAALSIAGGANLTAGGAVTLASASTLKATSTADASVAGTAGASVAVSVISGDTTASVNGAAVSGASVALTAASHRTITTTAKSTPGGAADNATETKSQATLAKQKAATSQGQVRVAGAVAVGTDTGATTAFLNNAAIVAGTGAVTVSASPVDILTVTADGSFTKQGTVGVGVAVAIAVADRSDLAYVGGVTKITAGSLEVRVLAPEASLFSAQATSGVGDSSKVGVAGALAVTVATLNHEAYLAAGATLTLTGAPAVTFEARANVGTTAKALPADGGTAGSVGIGASVAVNSSEDRVVATIRGNAVLTGAGDLSVLSDATHAMTTEASGGGKGAVAITPIIAIATASHDVQATLGGGPLLTIGGAFTASAALTNDMGTSAEGDTKSGNTGVGVSLALAVVNDTALATTARDLTATAGGAAFLSRMVSTSRTTSKASVEGEADDDGSGAHEAQTSQSVDNKAKAEQTFGDKIAADQVKVARADDTATVKGSQGKALPSATTSDGKLSVAGAVAINVVNASAMATIPDLRRITAGGALSVMSSTQVDGHAIATGAATVADDGTGVGAGVAVNLANNTNLASVGANATIKAAGLTVEAGMADREVEIASSTVQVVDIAKDTIFVGMGAGLSTGDKVTYGGLGITAIGGLTIGTSYYVNALDGGLVKLYDTKEHAEAGKATGLKNLTSAGVAGQKHLLLHGALAFLGEGEVSVTTGTIRLLDLDEDLGLHSGDAVAYDSGGGAVLGGLATGRDYYLIEVGDGKYQVADSREDARDGTAITLGGAGGAKQGFTDRASNARAEATSGGSGGAIGVAGSVAVNIAKNDSQAVIKGPTILPPAGTVAITITGTKDVTVSATNTVEAVSIALPSGDGGDGEDLGIGASVAVNVVTDPTVARIADNVTWAGTSGALTVEATSAVASLTQAENGASSDTKAVGIGAAVAVVRDTTTVYLGTGTSLTVSGAVTLAASHEADHVTETSAETAGANVGVGASVSVAVINDTTSAELARSITTTGGGFALTSDSTVASTVTATASAAGTDDPDPFQTSKANPTKTGADGQADRQINDNANTKAADTKLPSASDEKASADGKSGTQGGKKSGDIGVAASVAVNVLNAGNTASITSGADVSATEGSLAVTATATFDATTKATGSAVGLVDNGGTRIGIGVAVGVLTGANRAFAESGSALTGKGITISAITPVDTANDVVVWAAEAAGGTGKTGIAGSVAINVVRSFDTEASARAGSTLNSSAGITILAANAISPQTVAAGVGFAKGNAAGVAVAVSAINAATVASIAGTADAAGAITVEARLALAPETVELPVVPDSLKPKATSIAAAGAAGTGSFAGAGSFIVGVYNLYADATIGDDARINQAKTQPVSSAQTLTVRAVNDTTITGIAGALSVTTGAVGIGASLDLVILDKRTRASIGRGAIAGTGGQATIAAASTETMVSVAATIGVGKSAGVALTAGIAIVTTNTRAHVDAGASLVASGAVSLSATSAFKTTMIAGSVGAAGTAGLGAANATLDHTGTTLAFIGADATVKAGTAGGLSIGAIAGEDILSIVAGVAVGGTAGVAGSAAVNILTETTSAYIGPRARITVTTGNLAITARDTTEVISVAGSLAAGGSAGVGVGVDVGTYRKSTNAYIESGVIVLVDGDIVISADTAENLTSVAAGIAVAGSVAVGVNAGVHVFDLRTRAFIGDDPDDAVASSGAGDVHAGGSVIIAADGKTDIDEVVGVLAAGTVGVAAGAGVTVSSKQTQAFIGKGARVTADGNLAGRRVTTGRIDIGTDTTAPTLSPNSNTFNPSAVNVTANTIDLGTDSGLRTGDRVDYSKGEGGTVIGGLKDRTSYYVRDIGNGKFRLFTSAAKANANSGAIDLTSSGAGDKQTIHAGHGIETSDASTLDIAASGDRSSFKAQGKVGTPKLASMNLKGDDKKQQVDDPSLTGVRTTALGVADGFRGVAVSATNRDEIRSFTVTFGAGSVGIAVSAGLADVRADASAYIGDNALVNASLTGANAGQSVLVGAGNDFHHLSVGVGVGVGKVGIAPTVGVNVITNATTAQIGANATVRAMNDITVVATGKEDVVMVGMGVAAGGVGVGAVVDVLSISNRTTASIGAGATVHAGGDVFVSATDDTHVLELSGALAGGLVGIGGAVGVMLLDKTTIATIGAGAKVDGHGAGTGVDGVLNGFIQGGNRFVTETGHGVIVQAQSTETIMHIVAAGGVGFVGVSGAVGLTLINSATTAMIGASAQINRADQAFASTAQNVHVNASNDVEIDTFIIGVAGGFVGVTGAVNIGTLNNNTLAEVQAGAGVTARGGVKVNALGLKDLGGYTISGAGGVVAAGASVDVWSIGTKLNKGYADNSGNSKDSVSNGNGDPDKDAAAQAQKGAALITGAKGLGSLKGDGANSKTSANRVAGVMASASASINSRAPGETAIVGLQGRTPAAPGTTAIIRAGADIVAGGNIDVTGWANTKVSERLGGVAVGGLGLGASVAIFSIADNVTASNDGTSTAGGDVRVTAYQFSTVDITSLGMQAGFVGLGAAVVVIDDSTVTTASLGTVKRASNVGVTVLSDRKITETTGQISVGAVGAGATFTRLNVQGDAFARVNAGAVIGGDAQVRSLTVQAFARVTTTVTTVAVSAGIGAFNANFADMTIAPTVSAVIGAKANVWATGAVTLLADTFFKNTALTKGVAAGGLAVGVSLTEITVAPVLRAEVGAQAWVAADTLTIIAGSGTPATGYDALAQATGSAGALVGVTSTNSRVVNNARLDAIIGDGAQIAVSRSITVSALNNMRQKADADSKAGGLVAAGAAKSEVLSNSITQATLGAGVAVAAQSLTVEAIAIEDNFARTNAGSGGAIAGASATARTTNTSTTLASIGKGSIVALYGDPGALSVVADHTALFNAQVTSLAGGVLAGAGGEVTNLVSANVTAAIGDNAIITARAIEMLSVNRVEKPLLAGGVTENLKGTTGGLASAAGATDTTTIHVTTKVRVGNGAQMTILGANANEHSFSLSARNEYNVHDKVAFVTGGAVSGAMAFAGISVPTAVAAVEIGVGAVLTTTDAIDISARGAGELSQEVFAETYGAGTATVGSASVDIRPDNRVFIGANAKITALGDINLSAGSETNFTEDAYHLRSRFDGFAGSLIPLSDVGASASLVQSNAITIASGAHLLTARAANLFTGRFGTNDLDAKAKVTSWISEATSAINQAGGGGSLQDFANSTIISTARGVIQMDGKVETGLNRNLSLTLKDWNGATGQITDFSATKGITFTTSLQKPNSALSQDLITAQKNLARYSYDAQAKAGYQAQIDGIIAALRAQGLVTEGKVVDSQGRPVVQIASEQYVMTVTIDPILADSGAIRVRGDVMQGSGTWIAPNDVAVTIVNDTPASLRIMGIAVPSTLGGLYFNGDEVSTNAAITTRNDKNTADENAKIAFNGWNLPPFVPGKASFDLTNVKFGATAPSILIQNRADIAFINGSPAEYVNGKPTAYPWPAITVVSTAEGGLGIQNLLGSVTLQTKVAGYNPNSKGPIYELAPVQAKAINIEAGGETFINLPDSNYESGGSPMAQWDAATTGSYNPNNPAQVAPGVKDASKTPGAIAAVLAQQPTAQQVTYADRITIDADIININGKIQSGRDTFTLTLGTAVETQINKIIAERQTGMVRLTTSGSEDFAVYFDTATRRIEVQELIASGGYISMSGNIVNTGNGRIDVFGGYANISITNDTSYEMVLHRLDVSERGTGTLIIHDKSLDSFGQPYVTTIQQGANGLTVTTSTGDVLNNLPPDLTYAPVSNWRYGWTVGLSRLLHYEKTVVETNWIGIDTGGATIVFDPTNEPIGTPTLEGAGPYYYRDSSPNDYNFRLVTEVLSNKVGVTTAPPETTWYGTETIRVTYTQDTGKRDMYSHDISAHRPIGIHFFGHDEATVNITSSRRSIIVDGAILNPSGTTTLDSISQILMGSDQGSVGGNRVALIAGTGIGTASRPIHVDVGSGPYAGLTALAYNDGVYIEEKSGNLPVAAITAANAADVVLTAPGSISVARQDATTWSTGRVAGGSITLTALEGGIGNGTDRALGVNRSTLANTVPNQNRVLNASATSDIFLTTGTGDLRVGSVVTQGNVWINVIDGSLIDANTEEVRDERTIEELKGGVWTSLQLTAETGYAQKLADSIESYKAAKTQDYQTYWRFRLSQPNGGTTFDTTFRVALTAAETAYYRDELGYDSVALEREITNRTDTYRNLNLVFGTGGTYKRFNLPSFLPDTYSASFAYRAITAEINTLTASIKQWTEEELLYGISAGLMKDVTSTVVNIENPNIVGANVTILTSEAVGMDGGTTLIDRTQPNVALTLEQRVALAAAERLDVQFLGGALLTTTVNFNAEARTITRTDGGNWFTSGFRVGMYVTIDGVGQDRTENATIRTTVFHRIEALSASVLTIAAGSTMVTENARPITIAPVVVDPNFQALAPAQTATASFTAGTETAAPTITRTDGGNWITDGFVANQLLRVSGSADNSTTGSLAYRIASVTGTVITLSSSARVTTDVATVLTLTRGILPTITAIRINHLDDINVTAAGRINITSGKNILLGSTTDIRIDQVTTGNATDREPVRIKGSLSILDAAAPGLVNIRASDVILEAAQGGIGTRLDPIEITFRSNGGFTARARDGIYVDAVASSLRLESVYSESGDAYLSAGFSILERFNNDLTKIKANRIELVARDGSIGAAGPSGWVDVEAGGIVNATASEGVWLWQQAGDLTIGLVQATFGDVGIRAKGSILDDVPDDSDWITDRSRPNVDVRGNSISLSALNGGIGSATSTLDIDTQYALAGALSASSAGQDIYINEISYTLQLDTISTGTVGTAFISALTGPILRWPATTGINIVARNAVLSAVGDIGASSARITTQVKAIEARANPGSIWLDNMGALSIGGDMTTGADAIIARGTAWLSASGPITIRKNMVAGASIVVIATDDARDGNNAASGDVPDNIVVNGAGLSGEPLTMKAGNGIRLSAGDNLTIQSGAVLQGGIRIRLEGDYQGTGAGGNPSPGTPNLDVGVGGKITVAGKLVAPSILIEGQTDQDVVTITNTGVLLAMYSWTPATWNADVFGAQRIPFKRPPGSSASEVTINVRGAADIVSIAGDIRARTLDILREETFVLSASANIQAGTETVLAAGLLPVWQMAEGPAPTAGGAVPPPSDRELLPIVTEAVSLWTDALGLDSSALGYLDGVTVTFGALPEGMIGMTVGDLVVIDRDAAGWGWFVDPTPEDSHEFAPSTDPVTFGISSENPAFARMDLLTTVLHELGNAMGFPETVGPDVMGMTLPAGTRRLPLIDLSRGADVEPLPGERTEAVPAWVGSFVNNLGRPTVTEAGIRIRAPTLMGPLR